MLPMVRGAWLLMSRPKSLDSRRFFQLSADGASLRWCVTRCDCVVPKRGLQLLVDLHVAWAPVVTRSAGSTSLLP